MKNVHKPLAKNFLAPLGLTAAASAADGEIQKRIFSSATTTLIISNKEMGIVNHENSMRTVNLLKNLVYS